MKNILRAFTSAFLFVSLVLLVWGCECRDDCGPFYRDLVFTYPSPTIPPGDTKPRGLPLKDATNVPLNIVIIGTSSDINVLPIDPSTFTMTVSDGSSAISGRIEISFDYSSVIFIPDDFLKSDTIYTITVSQSNPKYSSILSFTTVENIDSNLASVGQGYALIFPKGGVTWPPGIGDEPELLFPDIQLFFATIDKQLVSASPDSGYIQFIGGEGNTIQTGLNPRSFVFSLPGSYLGLYIRFSDMVEWDIEGFHVYFDNFIISGKFADWSAYGGAGIGITDGTLTIIYDCSQFRDIMPIPYCTDTGYLIVIACFYAPPFTVTPATDLNGRTLAANITSPTDGGINVPVNSKVWVDFTTTTPGEAACIAVTSTSVSLILRDWTTGAFVPGTTLTTTGSVPGCDTGGHGQIVCAIFSPTSPLVLGRQYKALSVLDLSPVAGATFTTQ